MDIPVEIRITMPEGVVTVHGYLDEVATHRQELTFQLNGRLRPNSFWVAKGTPDDYTRHHVRSSVVPVRSRTLSGSLEETGQQKGAGDSAGWLRGTYGAPRTLTLPLGAGPKRTKDTRSLTKRQARRKRANEKRREYKKPAVSPG
jgi:hypothetical protein